MTANNFKIAAIVSNDRATMNKQKCYAFASDNHKDISSSATHKKNNTTPRIMHVQTELDSHADSIVVSPNFCIMDYNDR